MRVTQQDIARFAKVSQATVSRVLAGDEKVEVTIRDRVLAAIEAHNYRPDVRAQSLRSRRTGLIGLVLNRPSGGLSNDPFFASLIAEILDHLRDTPYHLCLDMVATEDREQGVYDEMLRSRRVDALILVESEARDERLSRLQQDQFPFVLIGNPIAGESVCSVDNDNVLAGQIATGHLVENGFKRIGFLGGRRGVTVSDDRISGYLRAIQDQTPLVYHCDFGMESARLRALDILASPDRPDALVALDDFMAMGVIAAARELDLTIPNDLGIVSFNNSTLCKMLECGLTSVSMNIPEIIRTACNQLLAILDEGVDLSGGRSIVPCELKVRGSSRRHGVYA